MAGVPHHAAQNYIDILVDKGYKVAVVEQMENPADAEGMVKREVVQLVTPGTRMKTSADAAKENNYLVGLATTNIDDYGLAYTDLSTGEIKVTDLQSVNGVLNEISRLETKEVVTADELPSYLQASLTNLGILVYKIDQQTDEHAEIAFLIQNLTKTAHKTAADTLLKYLFETQKRSLDHLQQATAYEVAQYLKMDRHSRANLELTVNLRTQQRSGTLLWLLDETKTAMGGRALKQWLEQPLLDADLLAQRYDKIGELIKDFFGRAALQEALQSVYDLERLAGRVAYGTANGRDYCNYVIRYARFRNSDSRRFGPAIFGQLHAKIDPVADIETLISDAITDEPPISVTDGGVIRAGYNEQLDSYRDIMTNGKTWLAELEAHEREETGINSLKIGF